jgi:hypothetical protein
MFGKDSGYLWGVVKGLKSNFQPNLFVLDNFCNNKPCGKGKTLLSNALIALIIVLSCIFGGKIFHYIFILKSSKIKI